MKRSILVTGGDTYIGQLLVKSLEGQGDSVVASVRPRNEKAKTKHEDIFIPWQRWSPVSAKNLVLESSRLLPSLDEVYFVISPEADQRPISGVSTQEIEMELDEWGKGFMFLVRELSLLWKENHGVIRCLFFLEDEKKTNASLSFTYEGAAAFFQALMKKQPALPFDVYAYECRNGDGEGFIQSVTGPQKAEKPGWVLYPAKGFSFGQNFRRSSL